MNRRCDGIINCNDKSDENGCNVIDIDESNYRKEQSPTNTIANKKLEITTSFDIFTITQFREVGQSFNINFLISVTWVDYRLTFKNLKESVHKNVIGVKQKESLWIPPLVFNNSEETTMLSIHRGLHQPIVNMFVERLGSFEVADPSFLDETYFYKGTENPLLLKTEYNMILHCNYKLEDYPFDTQICTMEVRINKFNKRHNQIHYFPFM